jgi:hypothetical protein
MTTITTALPLFRWKKALKHNYFLNSNRFPSNLGDFKMHAILLFTIVSGVRVWYNHQFYPNSLFKTRLTKTINDVVGTNKGGKIHYSSYSWSPQSNSILQLEHSLILYHSFCKDSICWFFLNKKINKIL